MKAFDEVPEKGPIDLVYAAIATDADGVNEGIVGIPTEDGWLPLVVTNRADLDLMLGRLQPIADQTGRPIRVVKYERAGLVGEFRPGGTKG